MLLFRIAYAIIVCTICFGIAHASENSNKQGQLTPRIQRNKQPQNKMYPLDRFEPESPLGNVPGSEDWVKKQRSHKNLSGEPEPGEYSSNLRVIIITEAEHAEEPGSSSEAKSVEASAQDLDVHDGLATVPLENQRPSGIPQPAASWWTVLFRCCTGRRK